MQGGIGDKASNVQAAGRMLYEEGDMDHCQNHGIKSCHDDMSAACPIYAADLNAVSTLCTFVAGSVPFCFSITTLLT